MKILPPLLVVACTLVPYGAASGALLIGFNSFSGGTAPEVGGSGTNYLAPGFSGFYHPSTGVNKVATGGSTDQTYGDSAAEANTPDVGNGYVSTYTGWFPFLELTNNSGETISLDKLLYDGAASSGATSLTIGYRYGTTGTFTDLVTTPLTTVAYQSFSQSISSLQLNNGQTIQFQFAGGIGGQLDNFGVTAVPEPGSTLIAGGLLGMIALRRRA